MSEFGNFLLNPSTKQANYWFFPALISVMIVSYGLLKLVKKPWIFLAISFVLNILLGENAVISSDFNPFVYIGKLPVFGVVNNYISISAMPQYMFFYAIGCFSVGLIRMYIYYIYNGNVKSRIICNSVGTLSVIISAYLMLKNIMQISISDFIYSNSFWYKLYVDIIAILIAFSVLYLSSFMMNSKIMLFIGKNTMSLMGLEYITHGWVTLNLLPMINLGIPNLQGTVNVLIIVALQFLTNYPLILFINKCFPILNGKSKLGNEICSKTANVGNHNQQEN